MASICRQPAARVITKIQQQPQRFTFFQACRLLYQLSPNQQEDCIQFITDPSLGFPVCEVVKLQPLSNGQDTRCAMTVNFMGLVGVNGILPFRYTEQIIEQQRQKSTALSDFFSTLQQRSITLFYRAWRQNRPLISYQTAKKQGQVCDDFSRQVLSLTGISNPTATKLPCHHDALVSLASHLLGKQRSRFGLSNILEQFFCVKATVNEFCSKWLKLQDGEQSLLPNAQKIQGQHNHLGVDCMLGERVLNLQSKVRVVLGPLTTKAFNQFLPCGKLYPQLCEFIRYYLGPACCFDIQLNLMPEAIAPCQLQPNPTSRLGWSSWLAADSNSHFTDQVILSAD